jgi:hypothetical protein
LLTSSSAFVRATSASGFVLQATCVDVATGNHAASSAQLEGTQLEGTQRRETAGVR